MMSAVCVWTPWQANHNQHSQCCIKHSSKRTSCQLQLPLAFKKHQHQHYYDYSLHDVLIMWYSGDVFWWCLFAIKYSPNVRALMPSTDISIFTGLAEYTPVSTLYLTSSAISISTHYLWCRLQCTMQSSLINRANTPSSPINYKCP